MSEAAIRGLWVGYRKAGCLRYSRRLSGRVGRESIRWRRRRLWQHVASICRVGTIGRWFEYLINEVITPALSDRKGFMILVGTPKGMANLFYDYYQKAQADPKWFLYKAKASETGIVDKEELDAALAVMGSQKYEQEFECSFIGNIQGSI